jgi:DHA1 family multidrug/chloramphenicol efflux transport protein-like MFS transporter
MKFWFPAFLVLFEFSTYVSNDMIMPGMPHVVHDFHVGIGSASFALSAALLGNILLQWLLGPLSDHKGRRPVLLGGVIFFILSCLAMYFARTMTEFVVLRALQGAGVAFVAAVGYPSVQEAFDEATAVRTVALMASVALLAPLIGPVLGAIVVTMSSWRTIFGLIAAVACISLAGLWRNMPETALCNTTRAFTLRQLLRDYLPVLRNSRVLLGSAALGLSCIPLMNWIGLAPIILIEKYGMSPITYGWWQLPVFGAMILGNVLVARLAGRWPLARVMRLGLVMMVAGVLLACAGRMLSDSFTGSVAGFALYAMGIGPCYTAVYRDALFASDGAKGTVAAAINTLFIGLMALGVEVSKWVYVGFGELALLGVGVLVILTAVAAALRFAGRMRVSRDETLSALAS